MTDTNNGEARLIMDEKTIAARLEALAEQVLERHPDGENLALLGIQRRGVFLAQRLGVILQNRLGKSIPDGILDINLYRDDWTTLGSRAIIGRSMLNFDVTDKKIILVDDVLYTGRTIRSAMEALVDFGRPSKLELLVMVDRGHRELPIQPDYVGVTLDTARDERVDVLLGELDGQDKVVLRKK